MTAAATLRHLAPALSTAIAFAAAGCKPERGPGSDKAAPPASAAAPRDSGNWIVDIKGAGPIRYGMTTTEASAAAAGRLQVPPLTGSCDFARVPSLPALMFMLEHGRIVRADVIAEGVSTDRGATIGMSEKSLRRVYGDSLASTPHKYDDQGHYLIYTSPDPADSTSRIVFDTDGQVLRRFRAGLEPAVEYVEGCG